MTAELILQFNNTDDLDRVLKFLRDNGLESLTVRPKKEGKKTPKAAKRTLEGIGSVNLGGQLDHLHVRDLAYA
jgi:hypothetical protein